MILSCALFAGATHAWFTDRCSARITLQSATFDVNVEVTSEEGTLLISPDANGVYKLSTGKYTVKLTRDGNATENVGYCVISVGDDVYYSPNLPAQTDSFSFSLMIAGENVSVTFTPVWSDAAQADLDLIPISETGITYADPNAVTFSGEPEPDETAQAEPDETTQTGTNNSAGDNSETGEGPTESSNSSGSEPAGETGAEGTSAGETAEESGSANG